MLLRAGQLMRSTLMGKFGKGQQDIIPFTSKRGPRNFYKGKGSKPMGKHTRKGGYMVDSARIPEIVVPDLTDCELQPYVSFKTEKVKVSPLTKSELADTLERK